jgi:hypothetical protein
MKLTDFDDLVKIVSREDALRKDMEGRSRDLRVRVQAKEDGKGNRFTLLVNRRDDPGGFGPPLEIGFTRWGLRTLLEDRLKLPGGFLEKDAPAGIAQDTLDHFLKNGPDRGFRIRVRKAEEGWRVLGVMSSTLPRFTYGDMLDAVGPLAQETGMKVIRYGVGDESMFAHLVFPREEDAGDREAMDPHRFGIWLAHSDTGFRTPRVDLAVMRVVCTNGMVGLSGEPVFTMRRSALHNLRGREVAHRIRARVLDLLKAKDRYLEILRSSRGEKIRGESARTELERVLKYHGLPRRTLGLLADAFRREAGRGADAGADRFQIAQAMTRAAQGMEPGMQERFERAAWNYLQGRN